MQDKPSEVQIFDTLTKHLIFAENFIGAEKTIEMRREEERQKVIDIGYVGLKNEIHDNAGIDCSEERNIGYSALFNESPCKRKRELELNKIRLGAN